MRLSGRHWLTALAAAATVHVGALIGFLWQAPDSGAMSAGFGGIEISLGPAGGEAASEADAPGRDTPTKAPPPQPSPPVENSEPIIPEQEPDPPKEAVSVTQERVEPVIKDEPETPVPPPTPIETEVSTAEVPHKITPPERDPQPPEPAQAEPPQPEPPARAAESTPEPAPVEPRVSAESTSGEHMAALDPSARDPGDKSGQAAGQDIGSGDASPGGGSPGAVADYAALIRAWLERHKQYPRRARLRRQEGTALLYFVMNRQGRVLKYRIQQSSGSVILDREVKAMIERAKPLPEMPQDMHQARLELIVPVRFSLR